MAARECDPERGNTAQRQHPSPGQISRDPSIHEKQRPARCGGPYQNKCEGSNNQSLAHARREEFLKITRAADKVRAAAHPDQHAPKDQNPEVPRQRGCKSKDGQEKQIRPKQTAPPESSDQSMRENKPQDRTERRCDEWQIDQHSIDMHLPLHPRDRLRKDKQIKSRQEKTRRAARPHATMLGPHRGLFQNPPQRRSVVSRHSAIEKCSPPQRKLSGATGTSQTPRARTQRKRLHSLLDRISPLH